MRYERLKQAREMRGFSQQDLAERMNTSARQISRYENGENDPTGAVLARLSTILEVSTDWLLGVVDETNATRQEPELTPEEWRFVLAYRDNDVREAFRLLMAKTEGTG